MIIPFLFGMFVVLRALGFELSGGVFKIQSQNHLPRLASNQILLISASWVAGITGVSHWCVAL
jgi:hypothetical protein